MRRAWEPRRRSHRPHEAPPTSYYGLPVIHKAPWKWEISLYFFLGGISGASYVLATIADWLGGPANHPIARIGRYLSLATLLPSPLLLILDLGRPERFYMMLRVIKLRSPMSVGTWGLLVFSAFCGLSTLIQGARDGLIPHRLATRMLLGLPRHLIGLLGSGPAFFVSGYTGVLLGATAVPLWAKNALLLGPLFIASSVSTACAALALLLSLGTTRDQAGHGHQTLARLERLDLLALTTELVLILAARRHAGPIIGQALNQGQLRLRFRVGVLGLGILTPLLLILTNRRRAHPTWVLSALGAFLTLVGGLMLRTLMIAAGRASADDPAATFAFTKKRS